MLVESSYIPIERTLETKQKKVVVLGSTGSIGTSTLDIIRAHPERFCLHGLVAHSNVDLMRAQVEELKPAHAVLVNELAYGALNKAQGVAQCTNLAHGENAMLELVSDPEVDLVVAGIVGTAGLRPVYTALQQGKCTALANKESLVVGGRLLEPLLKLGGSIVPVDSEHSAIFQCLQGSFYSDISRLVLTASGGPFWQKATHELQNVSPAEARRHPNWSMGAKVSIDSATMMNKALELVEAYWLFGVPAAQIDVLIHPQSIVHSLVEFRDGGMLAQLSQHDMRGAIAYALNYPAGRLEGSMAQMGICDMSRLEFHELDRERFPAIELAKRCIEFGRDAAAVMNIANEVLVEAFCQGKTSFTDIVPAVEKVVGRYMAGEYDHFAGSSSEDSSEESLPALVQFIEQIESVCRREFIG